MSASEDKSTPLGPILADGNKELPFGKYRLIRKIAVGGMAEVYLAKSFGQFGFEKPVVIKVMLPKLSADAEFVDMFVNEALMAADFRHPRICQVYDVGEALGMYYISMEFVDGVDLTRIVRRAKAVGAPLPMRIAIKIGIELTKGLAYVHNAKAADGSPLNIVHRDVTPQNIMVGFDGQVKLVDFGVAKTSLVEELKRAALKGKGPYMAPEQWRGTDVDARADIFALGIVLYEMTVGRRLFRRGNPDLVRKAIPSGEIPPPLLVRSDYPPELEEVVLKALALDPEDRFRTAAEMGDRLEHLAVDEGLDASTDEMATYLCKLFAGVNRDEVFRPLELTAPGHAAAALEREETSVTEEESEAEQPEDSPRRWKLALLAGGAVVLLGLAYGLGAWIHSGPGKEAGKTARARTMAVSARTRPVVATPGQTPEELKGCRAAFGAVRVDVAGQITWLDDRLVEVTCRGKPAGAQAATLRARAATAVRSWRFSPVLFRGEPVATTTPLDVTFAD